MTVATMSGKRVGLAVAEDEVDAQALDSSRLKRLRCYGSALIGQQRGEEIMPETLPERHFRDRLKSIGQLASLPEAERAAMTWQDYQDLAALCVELSIAGRELLESDYRRIFKMAATVAWLIERRNVIEELSDNFVRLTESVKSSAQTAWQDAGSPPGKDLAALLDAAMQTVRETKRSVLERWPVGSPAERAEVGAAIARGETHDIDEAFAEIAGTDVPTWRRRIREYKEREQ